MKLWNSHPKVYLDVARTGEAKCPYCGTVYRLKAGEMLRAPALSRAGPAICAAGVLRSRECPPPRANREPMKTASHSVRSSLRWASFR